MRTQHTTSKFLDPEVRHKIEEMLTKGYGINATARAAGVASQTVRRIRDAMNKDAPARTP